MSAALALVPAASSTTQPYVAPPPASRGTGHDRALLDGVTLDRPFGMVTTILNNAIEHLIGFRDDRLGNAVQQVALAGTQLVQATLRHAAAGKGVIATGSSVLSKVLPFAGIASGVSQVWQGWHELDNPTSVLDIIGSRTARSGLLSIVASGLLFFPGVGTALSGAVLRIVAGANELDAFQSLDKPTRAVEERSHTVARRVHPFDETPQDPYD